MNRRCYKAVWKKRGDPSRLNCIVQGDHSASQWAWVHGTDPEQLFNYMPMCRAHHAAYGAEVSRALR